MNDIHPDLCSEASHVQSRNVFVCAFFALLTACVLSGCQTSQPPQAEFGAHDLSQPRKPNPVVAALASATNAAAPATSSIVLREGDVVKAMFPSAANLNTVQPIRRDGKITLQMVGEITAAGLTPKELEAEILKAYAGQLLTKEVTVMVESSGFPVFVTGAVLRPGKLLADRPLTVLEAIMEAGGFDYSKANLKSVQVIRREGGNVQNFRLNLKLALEGKSSDTFSVKPSDIIYVPERFTWF